MLFSFQLQILFPNVTPFSSSQSHSFYYGRKLQINVYSFVRYTFCSNFLMLFFIFLFFYQNFIIYHSTCLIIFIMQGFKGLLPRQTLTDQAFLPIYKKAQDHRKAAQMCIDFFQQINKFFQSFSVAVEKCIQDADIQNLKASYYCLIGFVCTKLLIENKNLTDNTKGSSKQLTKLCNVILQDFSKYLQAFQGNLRKYQESQNIVQELSKKYFRSHKNMLASIESYKASLTDVTLIYNVEEQIKRYQTCETNYKTVTSQFQAINEKSQGLTQKKLKIVKNYEDFKTQFTKVIKMIGSKVISETKNFVNYYCITNKNIATFLAEQKYNLQREQLRTFFSDLQDPSNPQHFDLQKIPQRNGKNNIPLIFLFPQLIKQQHIESYNSQVLFYLKKIQQNIESRKSQNKRILDLFSQYFKIIQRVHIIGVKEIIQNFDKLKKKLIESFGPRLASFMKSMNAIFQLLSGINEKLVKNINTKLISIQTMINEQGKLLKLFNDELRINIQKFIGKKQLKKLKQQQFTEQTSVINVQSFRKEVSQKVIFFKHLIEGFEQKMKKNCQKISQSYTSLVQDLNQSINQFYSLCCQYQQLYFGPEQFKKNFQIYQTDVENLIQKNKGYFQELVLNILKGDNAKVTFDGEFHKVQDFKKLKKPAPVQVIVSKQPEPTEKKVQKQVQQQKVHKQHKQSFEQNKMIESSPPPKKVQQVQKVTTTMIDSNDKNNRKPSTKQPAVPTDEKQVKNYQFILSKVQFKENEQYIKSFACAFSSKIVLQGRIYITTHRICFSSGFNSNNIFFGSTFIQFPKQDIVKLEKKTNTLLMDNSISFTTVKGELFFTSFFSRNEAYDLICKTFELSLDQHVYEYNQQAEQEKPPQMVAQIKQDDDLNDTSIEGRKESIDPLLTKFPYNQFLKAEFVKQGLNAYQILKIFYLGNEISMNRRKFPSFLIYIRQILGHKDVEIDPWEPPLEQIMNQSNIKENSPLKSERKIRATVPVANSGVPFMPKTAKSQQTQSLYIYSKHKWVLETEVNTTGAPYTDTFKVQLRTTFTSDLSGNCEIVVGLFINFVKNTMMKSVIESKSQQQSMKASKLWVDEMKKYFTALSKSENTNISKKGQNPIQQIKQELETKNTEIQSLTKQKQELVKEITSLKIQKEKNKKILIGLVALVVFLFILLIT